MNSEVFWFAIGRGCVCSNHGNAMILEHILKYSREKIHVDYILQYLIGRQLVGPTKGLNGNVNEKKDFEYGMKLRKK